MFVGYKTFFRIESRNARTEIGIVYKQGNFVIGK